MLGIAITAIFVSTWLGVMLGLREARASGARPIVILQASGLASVFAGIVYVASYVVPW